jgi:hypothetical protein
MTQDQQRIPQQPDDNDGWGMIVLIAFLLGVPLAGIVYSMLTK